MDQDSSKNQTQSSTSTTGPIPSGVSVTLPEEKTVPPMTPPAMTETTTPTTEQQPAQASGGLSMGFSMNPPAGGEQPAVQATPSSSAPSMDIPQSGIPPVTTPPPVDPGYTQTKSHRMTYIFIFLAIVIVVSLIVLFFYRQYMNITGQNEPTPSISPQITKVTSPTATPTVTPVNAEEADLQKINIEDIDQDLKDIQTDVNQLNTSPTPIK